MRGPWREAAEELARWMAERDYRGYDPFDAALSPLARPLGVSRWATVAWIQLHRRLPVQLRPGVGVRPHLNPKTLALAVQGHLRLGGASHREEAAALSRRLLALRGEEGAWGYPFPWANRHFAVPSGTPSSVPTAFAVHAVLDETDGREAAAGAARFLAGDLNRIPAHGGVLFSYTPLDRRGVHNASLLTASVLGRVGRLLDDHALLDSAAAAARTALRAQRPDGSWPYGLTRRDGWVDPYHTGYILTALRRLRHDLDAPELDEPLERGFAYWREAFLAGPAVAPRPGGAYPVDAHALAQGILTLSEFADEWDEAATEAERLGQWALANLRRRDGSFIWWKGRLLANRVSYMRWVQAWMFRALAELAAWREA